MGHWGRDKSFLLYIQEKATLSEKHEFIKGLVIDCLEESFFDGEISPDHVKLKQQYSSEAPGGIEFEGKRARSKRSTYVGKCTLIDARGRSTKERFRIQRIPDVPGKPKAGREQPAFQSDEVVLTRLDGRLRGRWNQSWITNLGVHARRKKTRRFTPFGVITGMYEEFDDSIDRLSLYRGETLTYKIKIHHKLDCVPYIKWIALAERTKGSPTYASPTLNQQLDERKLLEVVLENRRKIKGSKTDFRYFPQPAYYYRFLKRGLRHIEELLGERCQARIGGGSSRSKGCYLNPVFVFPRWVVAMTDEVDGHRELGLSAIYRPNIRFWFSFRRFFYQSSSSSGSGSSTTTVRLLDRKRSFLVLATPYKEYKLDTVALTADDVFIKVLPQGDIPLQSEREGVRQV